MLRVSCVRARGGEPETNWIGGMCCAKQYAASKVVWLVASLVLCTGKGRGIYVQEERNAGKVNVPDGARCI